MRWKIGRMLRSSKQSDSAEETAIAVPQTADMNTKFDDALGDRPVHLHYWPSYKNPYQALFYGAQTPKFTAAPNPIEAALDDLRSARGTTVCFHLHWLNFLFRPDEAAEVHALIADFLKALRSFCAEGGILLWTVHNLREHESSAGSVELDLRKQIADLATAVFVHGDAARVSVTADLPAAAGKIRMIEHGSYIGVYPDIISPSVARAGLGIKASDTVFLSLGWVRRYKGLTALCAAVDGLTHARLVIAGSIKARDKEELSNLFTEYQHTRLFEGWVADDDVQKYMNAADFVVLPYLASLTSGAAILALSFGVPVVAPAIGAFPEVIEDGKTGFLYDPEQEGALQTALDKAQNTTPAERARMRVSAYRAASTMTWSPSRLTLFETLAQAATPPD